MKKIPHFEDSDSSKNLQVIFCACENLEFLFGRNTFESAVTYEKGRFREFHARENGLLTPMHILHFKLFSGWYATEAMLMQSVFRRFG